MFLGHTQKPSGQPAVATQAGRLEQVTFRGPFQPQPPCNSVTISLYMRPLNGNVPVPNTAMHPDGIPITWKCSCARAKSGPRNC